MPVLLRESRLREQEININCVQARITTVEDDIAHVIKTAHTINRKLTQLELTMGALIRYLGLPPVSKEAVSAALARD